MNHRSEEGGPVLNEGFTQEKSIYLQIREMIEQVEKDRPYYYRSGGGMTLSGGECLCQPEFARDLLRAAKERGLIPPSKAWPVFPGKILRWCCPIWTPI